MSQNFQKALNRYNLGIIYRMYEELKLGASIENINKPNLSLGDVTGEELPMTIQIGTSYSIGRFIPAIDVSYRDRNINGKKDINVYGGIEYSTESKDISLRTGANLDEVALGASYNFISGMKLDYAFIYSFSAIKGILGSHRFGLTWQL